MNPYPGLRPFRRDETQYYSGREVLLQELTTRVQISPLTVLFARSGVGKSSFLSCRFIPFAERTSEVFYLNEWGQLPPVQLINEAIHKLKSTDRKVSDIDFPVLVLDQFEDVFKFSYDLDELWDKLAETGNVSNPDVHMLIVMREEWLGAWGDASDYLPNAWESVVRMPPLTSSEVRNAVLRPPKTESSVDIEDGLATELGTDLQKPNAFGLGGTYVEPGLLQLVCHRLWDRAKLSTPPIMSTAIYEELGRTDSILRGFIWEEIESSELMESRFGAFDRVLWCGLTRHLVIIQGVKAICTVEGLCRKLRIEDLGIAGEAVARAALGPLHSAVAGSITDSAPTSDPLSYLQTAPEKRDAPPPSLVSWVQSTIEKGVEAGFLKQQRGSTSAGNLYELTHDALGPILQQFSVEFESWVRYRWYKFIGILLGVVVGLPLLAIIVAAGGEALGQLLIMVPILAIYLGVAYVMRMIYNAIFKFPILRRLVKGKVPNARK